MDQVTRLHCGIPRAENKAACCSQDEKHIASLCGRCPATCHHPETWRARQTNRNIRRALKVMTLNALRMLRPSLGVATSSWTSLRNTPTCNVISPESSNLTCFRAWVKQEGTHTCRFR